MKEGEIKQISTLSTSGEVPYWFKLFWYSLDQYGTVFVHTCSGTVPILLSTYKLSGPNCTGTVCHGTSPTKKWVSDRNRME